MGDARLAPRLPALALAAVALLAARCVFVDCGFTYHARGRLVDGTGEPLAGAKLAVEERRFDPAQEAPDWPGFSETREDGSFDDDFGTGISWGYTLFLGLVVAGSRTAPLPPALDSVFVAVRAPGTGPWQTRVVAAPGAHPDSAVPAERWLDLGVVMLEPASASTTGSGP